MNAPPDWLTVHEGDAPLIVSFPHTGSELPHDLIGDYHSPWLARRDTDWWVHELYDFVRGMGATTVRSAISRSVIDLNRDPSGVSLYPGQNTTGLCPLTTFDNQPLYHAGREPDEAEIARRRDTYFLPYHDALAAQIARLRARHGTVVVYDAHSIRSHIPHLFDGELPQFNLGTAGLGCAGHVLRQHLERRGGEPAENQRHEPGPQRPLQGRLDHPPLQQHRRRRAQPADGAGLPWLHARTAAGPGGRTQLAHPLDPDHAAPLRHTLAQVLNACLEFATNRSAA